MLLIPNNTMRQKVLLMAVLTALLSFVGAAPAGAQNRQFAFYVQNVDSVPVTITLEGADRCYEGTPGNGEIFENVAPGAKIKIHLARVQGNNCDGKNAWFSLSFSPSVGVKKTQVFTFDNRGGLAAYPNTNQYPGKLSAKSPQDESYTYTTYASPKLTAGKPQGAWALLCQGNCNEEYSNAITNQTTRETTVSSETKSAVSVALEAGVEFEGIGSAKTTVTSSLEKTIGRSMSDGVLNAETNTRTKRVVYTPEQMNSLDIFAVWQWVAKTKLSNGQQILVKSDKITCTPNGHEPTYLPGSKEDVGACYGKKTTVAEQPKNILANLVGSGWIYNAYGRNYPFTFGQGTIDNFGNGEWKGVTWKQIAPDQIQLVTPDNKKSIMTFDSANSFKGIDFDGRTQVTGRRR